jgi:hypothetical protein
MGNISSISLVIKTSRAIPPISLLSGSDMLPERSSNAGTVLIILMTREKALVNAAGIFHLTL